jgi:hypothetical protein
MPDAIRTMEAGRHALRAGATGDSRKPGAWRWAAPESSAPQPLPDNITAAWAEAGARAGWIRVNDSGYEFITGQAGKPGDLPAFRLAAWPAGRLTKLPPPAKSFALYLDGSWVTNENLKELAGFTNLVSLHLSGTRVTDKGLAELAKLNGLQTLSDTPRPM